MVIDQHPSPTFLTPQTRAELDKSLDDIEEVLVDDEEHVHQDEDEEVTKTYLLVHFPFAKTTNSILQLSSEGDRRSYQISHSVEVESSQIQTFWYADWLSCLQAPEFSNWG